MTGYGRASLRQEEKTYNAELRGLNSKQTDLRLRTSHGLHAYELELRKFVLDEIKRGKVEMNLDIVDEAGTGKIKVDLPLLAGLSTNIYFNLKTSLPESTLDGLVPALLRTPGIIETGAAALGEEDWENVLEVTRQCLAKFQDYRRQEGDTLAEDLRTSVRAILGRTRTSGRLR